VGGVVEQEVEMLAKRSCWLLALCVALAVAAPAGAKEKEKPREIVAVSGSGVGVAPNAPAWVREKVAAIHAGKIESGGSDGPGALRGPEARKRLSWFGCKDVWAYRGYNHIFGYNLFRYYQQVSWCSNGYSIYSWSRFRWAELNGPGWGFDGHIDSYLGGSTAYKRAWTQGQFHACFAGFCDYKVPWVNIEVNVYGGWSANTGG
jgi:hypothetical protein